MAILGKIVQNFICKEGETLPIGAVFRLRFSEEEYIVEDGDGFDDCSKCECKQFCCRSDYRLPACSFASRGDGKSVYFKKTNRTAI
jgi:hypothetical protein